MMKMNWGKVEKGDRINVRLRCWMIMMMTMIKMNLVYTHSQSPRIQPANMLVEGRAMTIVCVALGDPTPTISLYINGELIKQQKNRHLTQVVDNVTRDMDVVTCYADNGYGNPMETTRRIQISRMMNHVINNLIQSLTQYERLGM